MHVPKRVAIVGAGPSGLVAAKTLLHSHSVPAFDVTVLEKSLSVGGLWSVSTAGPDGLVSPEMPANLSRYSVCFSDFAWESADLETGKCKSQTDSAAKPLEESSFMPMFPKARQVEKYLQAYAHRYLPNGVVRLNSTVTKAERRKDNGLWNLEWTTHNGSVHRDTFDYLVVATGFFSSPRRSNIAGLGKFPQNVIHSSQYRTFDDLVPPKAQSSEIFEKPASSDPSQDQTIPKLVVIGGGMSGVEAAASLALHISSRKHSPGSSEVSRDYQIHHVISRPFYALPPILPRDPGRAMQPSFTPLDMCMYNLSRRPSGDITYATGTLTAEKAKMTHEFLRNVIGGDQYGFGTRSRIFSSAKEDEPAYVAISEWYAGLVRAGYISPVAGKAIQVGEDAAGGTGTVKVEYKGKESILDRVEGIILATGFTPQTAISWLSPEVLAALQHDSHCERMPLLLQHRSTSHPDFPNLGFVGYYEGPYWGGMEMQARFLCRKWGSNADAVADSVEDLKPMEDLRIAIKGSPMVPQFWMGDYVGLMESFAREMDIPRLELDGYEPRGGPVIGARYIDDTADRQEANKTIQSLQRTLLSSASQAGFLSRAVFRAMHGKWHMSRELNSALPTHPSGNFTGTAKFHARFPTDPAYDMEMLYHEEGELVTNQGWTLRANRSYVYRYSERDDKITAWFVKPDDPKTVDYLFHAINFEVPVSSDTGALGELKAWKARSHHLCEKDDYTPEYTFNFDGVGLSRFGIKYYVKGPQKDYTSMTWFTR
ncbi:hypothetical protein L228DRAFT_258323 [Xylona heveae TC161]|uniref:Uncharacterized protein n=1 Tax=Xylona heveae (strain CBS 132557 / TC161) TaxID=1328760 RepID=A0A165K4J3_XYLHT|nr:hypothetical protein L228DRAFT_258323 [Xylona heveae TC161]KZF26974.1 hypothetical protein L228DRAFT_258323 [Xylona heveae TC161]